MKQIYCLVPTVNQGNALDFISIAYAYEKYHVNPVAINNKIKLFKEVNKWQIDRLQSGGFFLINEAELQEALRIKGSYRKVMNTNKTIKAGNKEISLQAPSKKNKTPLNKEVLKFILRAPFYKVQTRKKVKTLLISLLQRKGKTRFGLPRT